MFFQIASPEKLRIYSHFCLLPFYFCLSLKLALNWVCFHQVSNQMYFSYLLVIIDFVFISALNKMGLFFQTYPFNSFRISSLVLRVSGRRPVLGLFFQIKLNFSSFFPSYYIMRDEIDLFIIIFCLFTSF